MFLKILLAVFVLSIFAVNLQGQQHFEFVSPVLRKNKTDPNWFTYAGKTYYVNTVFKTNFFKAFQFCRQLKMQLLTINNQAENDRLGRFIIDNGLTDSFFFSSGTSHGGNWVWLSTGSKVVYTNWSPREPSGKTPQNEPEECMEIRHSNGFTWNDVPCSFEEYFICESMAECDCDQINR